MDAIKVGPLVLTFSLLLCLSSANSLASEVSQTQHINGDATLSLHNIGQSESISATWELNIQVPSMIGVDFLPDKDRGLRYQVDTHIGNGDGIISTLESDRFSLSLEENRSWTNGDEGGCCSFDQTPFFATAQIEFTPIGIGIGPIEDDLPWGWSERANLTGLGDERQIRLLDLPRTGSIVEEVPLRVVLPGTWEYRFSAQSAVITTNDEGFTVDRSLVPVSSDIRISLGVNEPPIASALRDGGGSATATSTSELRFTGMCTDNGLVEPIPSWSISGSFEIDDLNGDELSLALSEYDLYHGDSIHVSMTCTDRHNSSSSWSQSLMIDDEPPSLSISLQLSAGTGIWNEVELEAFDFSSPSGSVVRAMVSAIDGNNDPVTLTISSNRSGGLLKTGFDTMEMTEAFYHGDSANGPHREPNDRLIERKPTEYFLSIIAKDSAGNRNESNYTITIIDDKGPIIVPSITHDGNELDVGSSILTSEEVVLVLNQSYDRLDALNETKWTVDVDGLPVIDNLTYNTFNGILEIGVLTTGEHMISIQAMDPKGHISIMELALQVYPGEGIIFLQEPKIEVSGRTIVDNGLIISSSMTNYGSGTGFAKLCSGDICSPEAFIPPASLTGPGQTIVYLEVTPISAGELQLALIWNDPQADVEESVDLSGEVIIKQRAPTWLPPLLVAVFIISASSMAIRRWGNQASE